MQTLKKLVCIRKHPHTTSDFRVGSWVFFRLCTSLVYGLFLYQKVLPSQVMMLDLKMLFLWHLLRVRNIYITGILPEFLTKGFPALLNISKVSLFFGFFFSKKHKHYWFPFHFITKSNQILDVFEKSWPKHNWALCLWDSFVALESL